MSPPQSQSSASLISSVQRHLLGLGRVPSRRRRFVPRRRLSDQLYDRLKFFLENSASSWFLVWGMPGCGKTDLVASLLWDRPELCFAFFDKVIWVTDRHMEPSELENLAADTLLLATLCLANDVVLDQMENTTDSSVCSNGSEFALSVIARKLKAMLDDQMGTTLLVLDNVQMAETVRFFDSVMGPKCKIVATSTARTLFDPLEGLEIFNVPSDDGSAEELAELARLYGIEDDLPEDLLARVLAETGSNFALLEKLFVLALGNLSNFRSLLDQLPRRPLSAFACHSAYPYHSLEIPLRRCVSMLGDPLAGSFDCCSVLEPFAWTPFEILSLFWPLDVCGSESESELRGMVAHQLDTLEAHSLMDKQKMAEQNWQFAFFYRIHPLVHSFLLHSRPNSYATFRFTARALLHKLRDRSPTSRSDPGNLFSEYLAKNADRFGTLHQHIDRREHWGNQQNAVKVKDVGDGTDGQKWGQQPKKQNWNNVVESIGQWISSAFWK